MARAQTTRCNGCNARVVFFGSPFTGKPRTFEPVPVEPTHPLAGVRAFPIFGGTRAYKPAELVEVLQVQHQCSDAQAADEIRDMTWHLLHECHPTSKRGDDDARD